MVPSFVTLPVLWKVPPEISPLLSFVTWPSKLPFFMVPWFSTLPAKVPPEIFPVEAFVTVPLKMPPEIVPSMFSTAPLKVPPVIVAAELILHFTGSVVLRSNVPPLRHSMRLLL